MENFDDRDRVVEETKTKISDMLNMVYSKDYVQSISLFRRYYVYIIFSLLFFLILIYFFLKNILLLRWNKIGTIFYAVGQVDEVIKNHLEI
jgi:hypothetical protein